MCKNQPKVAVMMASYNGEKYIGCQIDSILNQTYDNIELYVRDDGSTDGTRDILADYAAKYANVHVILGEKNLGYPGCFYALTDRTDIEADYYAFSDQDDMWYEDKIARAVEVLEGQEQSGVLSYYAGYDICDGELNKVRSSAPVKGQIKFKDTLFDVCGLEFTMVINRAALLLLAENKPRKANARGTWMSMLFSAFGTVIYDNRSVAAYRKHGENVTNGKTNKLSQWGWRIKNFFFGGFDSYRLILEDFCICCGRKLPKKEYRILRNFTRRKYLPYVLTKVFFPHRLRRGLADELALRFVFLIGRL